MAVQRRIRYGIDDVRDRVRERLGNEPTKAALAAFAQATLDLIVHELIEQLTEPLEARPWRGPIWRDQIRMLTEVAECGADEPLFNSELARARRWLDSAQYVGVDGGYWNARRGELNYTEYFDTPLPTTEFILSVSKAIGLHARDVGVENFSYDSELQASHDTAMLLMGIQANSAAVN